MNKKDYLISLLTNLEPYRPLAEGILVLIRETEVTEEILDAVLSLLHQWVKNVQSEKGQEMFEQVIANVNRIKIKEEKSKQAEGNVDDLLENI